MVCCCLQNPPARALTDFGIAIERAADCRWRKAKCLRKFFEVDRHYIAVAALSALVKDNVIEASQVAKAIEMYGIDPEKPDPAVL